MQLYYVLGFFQKINSNVNIKEFNFLNVRGFLEEIVPYTIVCFPFYGLEQLNL